MSVETKPPVEIEVLIKYPDQDEPTIYRDANVLKRCLSIDDTLKETSPNWATEGIKLQTPVVMFWSKDIVEFCFNHAHRYTLPESPEERDLEDYKEANEKTLDELKQIRMCAYTQEYSDSFCKAIDFVIREKLPKESRDEFYGFYSDDDEDSWEDHSNTSWFWITVFSILFVLVVILVKQFS